MEQHQPSAQDAIALTKQLITIPSVSDDEAEILSFVAKWMDQAGFDQVITKERFTPALSEVSPKLVNPPVRHCSSAGTSTPCPPATSRPGRIVLGNLVQKVIASMGLVPVI